MAVYGGGPSSPSPGDSHALLVRSVTRARAVPLAFCFRLCVMVMVMGRYSYSNHKPPKPTQGSGHRAAIAITQSNRSGTSVPET
eukprot:scaffold289397_cov30-Tisochrysis_lutea.AAC.4